MLILSLILNLLVVSADNIGSTDSETMLAVTDKEHETRDRRSVLNTDSKAKSKKISD